MHAQVIRQEGNLCPADGWAIVTSSGTIHVHPTRRAEPDEWLYVLAHCLLHLGFGHFQAHDNPLAWNIAGDLVITRFLSDLRLGRPPQELEYRIERATQNEERLYRQLCEQGLPFEAARFSMGGAGGFDLYSVAARFPQQPRPDWQAYLAKGLSLAVTSAVNVSAGTQESLDGRPGKTTTAQLARAWFISSYPLLGALAATFKIIEDAPLCIRMGISIAAVDAEMREIYMNPNAGLDDEECRFVMAHELLHVGLSHHTRCQGRDPFL